MTILRRFLRDGTPWCALMATEEQASGSTLRRCLARWAKTCLLAKVHVLLLGMLRGHHDLILNACSVRAKRGGDLTGPNPTDRAKRGTKYHVAVDVRRRAAHPQAGKPRGSRLGKRRWPVERSLAWVLENRRLALRYDGLGFVVQSVLQSACIFLVAGRLAREF